MPAKIESFFVSYYIKLARIYSTKCKTSDADYGYFKPFDRAIFTDEYLKNYHGPNTNIACILEFLTREQTEGFIGYFNETDEIKMFSPHYFADVGIRMNNPHFTYKQKCELRRVDKTVEVCLEKPIICDDMPEEEMIKLLKKGNVSYELMSLVQKTFTDTELDQFRIMRTGFMFCNESNSDQHYNTEFKIMVELLEI